MMGVMVRPEHIDEDRPRCPLTRRQVIEILQAHPEQLRQFGVKKIRLFGSAPGNPPYHRATWTWWRSSLRSPTGGSLL
jgi:hypothetical protein